MRRHPLRSMGATVVLNVVAGMPVGFRIGRWWQLRSPGQQEGPTEMLVGSILTMLAFLLAVTMDMASAATIAQREGLVVPGGTSTAAG